MQIKDIMVGIVKSATKRIIKVESPRIYFEDLTFVEVIETPIMSEFFHVKCWRPNYSGRDVENSITHSFEYNQKMFLLPDNKVKVESLYRNQLTISLTVSNEDDLEDLIGDLLAEGAIGLNK